MNEHPEAPLRDRRPPRDEARAERLRVSARAAFVRAHRGESTAFVDAFFRHAVPVAFVGVAVATVTWATFAADAVLR